MQPPSLTKKNEPDISTGAADSILAGLWRKIKKDYDIDPSKLEDLIYRYADCVKTDNPDQRSQLRGNLRDSLRKDTMTWGAFIEAMNVIRVKKLVVSMVLTHGTDQTQHCLIVDLTEPVDFVLGQDGKMRNQVSLFFHQILHELGINPGKFEKLLNGYMVRARIPVTAVNRTHVRGNLKKELLGPKMSWKSFIKGIFFLSISRFDITAELTMRADVVSKHTRTIILDDVS